MKLVSFVRARVMASACALLAVACRTSVAEPEADASVAAPAETHAAPPPTTAPAPPAARKTPGWNAEKIDWQEYEPGLRRAKAENKPVCLVFSTTWCPHCRKYSQVFDDERVVARARDFVMIRVDADEHTDLSKKYAPDGTYVPRTYFLSSDGKLDASIQAERPRFRYFYDENDPGSLLGGMHAAMQKLAAR